MSKDVKDFLSFISASPTAFHAVRAISDELDRNGFIRLRECEMWQLKPGSRYYVTRNGSSVIAFDLPADEMTAFRITASHSDSPCFKLKAVCEETAAGCYTRLNVEPYGGMLMSTWLDRPLSIAGRVLVRDGNRLESRLVSLDRDTVLIPNMPIHFNREANNGYAYKPQTDLMPLYGDEKAMGGLMKEIAAAAGVPQDRIAGSDLYLYSRTPGSIWGAENSYFSCGRIDNLECAYTSMQAMISTRAKNQVNICAVFDNEEVGSRSKQGADSDFLCNAMLRIGQAYGMSDSLCRAKMAASFMVSADNAHALHPNHPDKFDADNRVYMNKGVVIKHNANQKYTTDGVSSAVFEEICRRAGVPVQHFNNHSDIAGGSTLGNLSNAHIGMNTVDIGLAQLAMHSAYETAGTRDIMYMTDALCAFYSTEIVMTDDGAFELN